MSYFSSPQTKKKTSDAILSFFGGMLWQKVKSHEFYLTLCSRIPTTILGTLKALMYSPRVQIICLVLQLSLSVWGKWIQYSFCFLDLNSLLTNITKYRADIISGCMNRSISMFPDRTLKQSLDQGSVNLNYSIYRQERYWEQHQEIII